MKRGLRRQSVIYGTIAVILTVVIVYTGIQALRLYIPQTNETRNFEELKNDAELADITADEVLGQSGIDTADDTAPAVDEGILRVYEQNHDFVGWLSIEDTVIDYPVMKSSESDPEFYLHRDFDGNETFSGTLFIGEGCDADSDIFVIYGHNMNLGTMFGELDSYADASYARMHKDILFRTVSGNRVYRVFGAFRTQVLPESDPAYHYNRTVGELSESEYADALEQIRSMSLISLNDAPSYPEQIMLMSTCAYHTDDGRFVVAAYRIA